MTPPVKTAALAALQELLDDAEGVRILKPSARVRAIKRVTAYVRATPATPKPNPKAGYYKALGG